MSDCIGCGKVRERPDFIFEFPHSVLLLGEHQAFPGYCVLWSKAHVKELHHLEPDAYGAFMRELRIASAAVEAVTGCWKLNTVSLGNAVQHAHVHLMPRSAMDPERLRHPWAHEADFGDPGTPAQRQAAVARLRAQLEGRA